MRDGQTATKRFPTDPFGWSWGLHLRGGSAFDCCGGESFLYQDCKVIKGKFGRLKDFCRIVCETLLARQRLATAQTAAFVIYWL